MASQLSDPPYEGRVFITEFDPEVIGDWDEYMREKLQPREGEQLVVRINQGQLVGMVLSSVKD